MGTLCFHRDILIFMGTLYFHRDILIFMVIMCISYGLHGGHCVSYDLHGDPSRLRSLVSVGEFFRTSMEAQAPPYLPLGEFFTFPMEAQAPHTPSRGVL
jgi:hypothetical protein